METGVGVKPTHARINMVGVVGDSSRLDAEFTAVRQDKGTPHGTVGRVGKAMSSRNASSLHSGLRVAGSTEGVCHLHGSGSWAPS